MSRGFAQYKEGELDDAIASFRKAIELDPNFPLAHHNLGLALQAAGQEEEAQQHLEGARRLGYEPPK